MSLSSYFKSPLSDLTGPIMNNQVGGPCGNLETKAFNCVEAYGEIKGAVKCKDLVEDLYECMKRTKEFYRVIEMRSVREKKGVFIEGPAHDSYEYPTTI